MWLIYLALVVLTAVAVTALVFSSLVYFDSDTAAGKDGAAGDTGVAGEDGAAGAAATSADATFAVRLERIVPVTIEGADTAVLGTMFTDGDAHTKAGIISNIMPTAFALDDSAVDRVFRVILHMSPSSAPGTQAGVFTATETDIIVTTLKGASTGTEASGLMKFAADLAVPAGVATITPFFQLTSGDPGGEFVYLMFEMYQIE